MNVGILRVGVSIEREPLCESISERVYAYAADLYARVQSKFFTDLFMTVSLVHFRSRSGPIRVGFLDRDQQWSLLHGLMIQIELLSSSDRRQLSGLHNTLTTNSDLRNMVQFRQYFNFAAYYC